MLIAQFFENQEIFITGGSGFIGKALIEKLLRSCPGVGKIFVLIRGKRGKNAEERLRTILKTSLFNRVRQEQPQTMRKVIAIEGDCSELGLGISVEDLEKLKNVSIVYHSAASVRFDDALRDAVLLNTRSAYELVKIAENLKNLIAFVHVSTTYCNPDKEVVEEKVYPGYADWRTTIKLAETYSTETLNILNLKYSSNQPNTYTFTKNLAEQIINDYRDKLPVVVFRPSIVTHSIQEPVPGWVDNFNGLTGLMLASGVGIFRTSYGNPDAYLDVVPVDMVTRAMIITAYKKGTEGHDPQSELEVINCATASTIPLVLSELIDVSKKYIRENPIEKTVWAPNGNITRCATWNFIKLILLQVLPAILIDLALKLSNREPRLLKLQRRIHAANESLIYFYSHSWTFKNSNFFALDNKVPKSECEKFAFLESIIKMDLLEDLIIKGLRGSKVFLLNEPAECTKSTRIRFEILVALNFFIQFIACLFTVRFLVRYFFKNFYYNY